MRDNRSKASYAFGPFRLNVSERLLLRDGTPVSMAPKVFDTLTLLVESSGRLVEKDELINKLWPNTFVEEATLARNISDLRRLLGEPSRERRYIETVPKSGYRFIAPVTEIKIQPEPLQPHSATVSSSTTEPRTERAKISLAVLPFKSLQQGEADEYLGLGLADALITKLSNVRELTVRPTSAVSKYANQELDANAAGRELGVDVVLEGSIRRFTDRLRISAQLVSVSQQATQWAGQFDEQITDIFALEDSISDRITAALEINLSGTERSKLAKRSTSNAAAYQAYLKGVYFTNKRTTRWIRKGLEQFEEATILDTNYAAAYAGLGDCFTLLVNWEAMEPYEGFSKAKAAARRALELDESLAEAHAGLAHAMLHCWEFRDAEREFKTALNLNPGYAPAYMWYSEHLAAIGRREESIECIKAGRVMDPVSSAINTDVGWMYYYARRFEEAIVEFRRAIDLDPAFWLAHFLLGQLYIQIRRFDEGIDELQQAVKLSGHGRLAALLLGSAYAAAGKTLEAENALAELNSLSKERYFSPYRVASIYAALQQTDRAFEWLERGFDSHDGRLIWLKVDPALDGIRSDSRYDSLLQRVGIPV